MWISVIKLLSLNIAIYKIKTALAGVAQWTERQPANQKVAGSIPSQGTCLDFGPGPQLGGMCEASM